MEQLPRGTVEWTVEDGTHTVRFRSLDGGTFKTGGLSQDEAGAAFWQWAETLRGKQLKRTLFQVWDDHVPS
jgi:hypothetical protein